MTGFTLIAQAEDAPKGGEKQEGSGPFQLIPLILIFVAFFYLMILRPNRQERQRQAALMAALKKNDEVVTASGILGIVTSIKDSGDEVVIKSDETRLRVLRSSILRIINPKETPAAGGAPAPDQAVTDLANKGKA